MDSPEHTCDGVKENACKQEDVISQPELALCEKQTKVMKVETQPQKTNVVEQLCEYYFASLKSELFLSSLYLVIVSKVVLLSVLSAFAKVRIGRNISKPRSKNFELVP